VSELLPVHPALLTVVVYASEDPAEDRRNIVKFGETYRDYMREVPALNFVAGLLRRVR